MFIWFWSGECSCKYKTGQLEEISTLYTDFTDTQPTMLVLTALFMFVHVGVEVSSSLSSSNLFGQYSLMIMIPNYPVSHLPCNSCHRLIRAVKTI